ncbi:hypothetical protein CYMTET_55226 [Cymbomonas tetramitiformis]|uniref:Uncharacterized protein n=1 Tax=Cymbomonas tetramitiformis TaxID=36881 RepID=A0AAE0BDY8_9CHLO|nr:hypothetical protein CYMTET_55226 [Cymbomonas tetramitiformis]
MSGAHSCSEDSMWPKSASSQGTNQSGSNNSRGNRHEVNVVDCIDQASSRPHAAKLARKHEAGEAAKISPSLARSADAPREQSSHQAWKDISPISVDELEVTLETLREQSKEHSCLDAVKITFDRKRFLCEVYEGRYLPAVEASKEIITQIMFRAACDHELPTEFREALPHLFLYPCNKTKIDSTDEETRIQLNVGVGDLLRCKYLLLTRLHDDEKVAMADYRKYEDKLNSEESMVSAFFIKGRSHQTAARSATDDHHTVVSDLGDNLSIYTAGDIRTRVEFRLTDRGMLNVYLILHALANWFDCPGMVKRSTKEFMGTLMAALSRYPDRVTQIYDVPPQA